MTRPTKGQDRVGVAFNPSGDALVSLIKEAAAALIDLIDDIPPVTFGGPEDQKAVWQEKQRLKALAMTSVEEAAMWAVKAATKR